MALVYRDSVVGDMRRVQSAPTELSAESLTASRSLLEQTEAKLGMMKTEFDEVQTKRKAATAAVSALSAMVTQCLTALTTPSLSSDAASTSDSNASASVSAPGPEDAPILPPVPVAPVGPAPPPRPVPSRVKGIALLSSPDDEAVPETDEVLDIKKSAAPKVKLSEPAPAAQPVAEAAATTDSDTAVPAGTVSNPAPVDALEIEALQLVLRVIDRHASTMSHQADEAILGNDLSSVAPVFTRLLQQELQRPIPVIEGNTVPELATDAALTAVVAALAAAFPPAAAKPSKSKPSKPVLASSGTRASLLHSTCVLR